ncbi:MAG: GH3 auxin-responsive promoter family protein [Planctomycetes bacterium]|nr:GH3 auxin-responsive promoter family protein [Planctomycetota bacterium]
MPETLRTSQLDRLFAFLGGKHAHWQFHKLLRAAHAARRTQKHSLRNIITRNADSDFGREHGFARIRTYRDFARRVPVQTYEGHRPYVERVMAGDLRALFGPLQRVLMFAITSGSTDRPKYVPVTPAFLRDYRRGWNAFGFKALMDHPGAWLRSIAQVVSRMDEHYTELGVPCGAISGLLTATQKRIVRKLYVVPPETARISDSAARYYAIMRFAVPSDVGWMVTPSPATQLKLARAAEQHAERLVRDLHDGTLTPPGEIPEAVRRQLAARLRPNRAAARRLTALANRHGALLPKHYWTVSFLANWTGGSMGLHLRDFPHYFGDVPVRDIGLLATEGRVSIPVTDGTPAGILDVGGSFFEFVEGDAVATDASVVHRCHELVEGGEYRVVMTTSSGLYRYDLGDYIRVHGFEGQAPIIEFLHRGKYVSSITGEKLTEWQAVAAFDQACRARAVEYRGFVLAPAWAEPPYYRLHIESDVPPPQELSGAMDRGLRALNVEYACKRSSGRLGDVVLSVLPSGTLARVEAERVARRGTSHEHYKPQCLLTNPGDDEALLGTVMSGEGRAAGVAAARSVPAAAVALPVRPAPTAAPTVEEPIDTKR